MTENKQQRLGDRLRARRLRRRRLIRRLFYLVLAVLLVVGCFLVALRVGGWPLGTLVISGDTLLTYDEIIKVSGIRQPVNVYSFSVADISHRLQKDPRVEAVAVWREWPLKVHIELAERVPVAYIATEYGYALIDNKGVVLAVSDSLHSIRLPLITGVRGDWQYIGDSCNDEKLQPMLIFLDNLDDNSRAMLAELNLNDQNKLTGITVDSVFARIGSEDRLVEKAHLIGQIFQDLKKSGVKPEYLDVQYATPVVKVPLNKGTTAGRN